MHGPCSSTPKPNGSRWTCRSSRRPSPEERPRAARSKASARCGTQLSVAWEFGRPPGRLRPLVPSHTRVPARDLRLLAGAVGLSALGDWLGLVALALHVEAATGSSVALAA